MKSKLFYRKARKSGLPPGTMVHVGEKKVEKTRITVLDYNEKQFDEREVETVEECFSYRDKSTITWINVDGLHEVDLIEKLGQRYGLHPLTLEDIVNTEQRPKFEDLGDYLFIILKMMWYNKAESRVEEEQVSLVVGSNFVISFQEKVGDVFDSVRDRIRSNKGRVRRMGSDYLAYSLIDAVVDNYFVVLEEVGEQIEDLEDEVMGNPSMETMQLLQKIKRRLLFLRKSVWPLREVVGGLERGESNLIKKQTNPYFRDVYDHTIQVVEMVETMRDMNAGMFDMYLSSVSNRMNETMKVLTIIATIFIPLTFIAGIYGMNFEFMPELKWRLGYFFILGIMAVVVIVMGVYFKRKKWM